MYQQIAAMAGGAIIGGMYGKISSRKGAKQIERMGRRESELKWQAVQENVRSMTEQHDTIMKGARADVGASGFAASSDSHVTEMDEYQAQFDRERAMTLAMGELERDIGIQSSQMQAKNYKKSAIASGAGQGMQIGSWFS